jgi:hypothetical protein
MNQTYFHEIEHNGPHHMIRLLQSNSKKLYDPMTYP